jgi:hypothetical protein
MGSKRQSIFFAKSSTLLSSVSPCIVSTNNDFSSVVLWLELSQYCKDIITIVLGIIGAPLRKCHDQVKSPWIPCNGNHDLGLGSYASPFQAVFLQVEARSVHDPSLGCRWLRPRFASSRETSRLIANPLNCTLRLYVIFLLFLTSFDFSLYTNKLKENFSVIILGMSSLWDVVFIQVLDRTGPLMLNLSRTPYVIRCRAVH